MAKSSLRGSLEFQEGLRDYQTDPIVRAVIDKAVKMADPDVLRDICIVAYQVFCLQGRYVASHDELYELFGLQKADLAVVGKE